MRKIALICVCVLFSLTVTLLSWDRCASVTSTVTTYPDTVDVNDTTILYFNMAAYNIERLLSEFAVAVPDSAESVWLFGYSSFDHVTWRNFWRDSTDSGSLIGAATDSHTFLCPAYCDTVAYYAPYLRYEVQIQWTIPENAGSTDSSGGHVYWNWCGFNED